MSGKTIVWIGVFVGSSIGGYLPSVFGADLFSLWGIVGSGIGGVLGIVLALKISS